MECTCELYFHVAKSICLLVVLLIDNAALIGIAVLFVICLVITLERFWNPEDSLVIQIKPTEAAKIGETVYLEGNVQFHHSLTCLKWQKYHNGGFVDINIHKPKYKGTTNTLQNPTLVLNDVDLDDEVKYRIEVQRTKSTEYSNLQTIHIVPVKDAETTTIEVFSDQKKGKYFVAEDVILKANITNPATILCMTWQKETETSSYTVNTSVPQYTETENLTNEHTLTMKNCLESDSGTYFLLAVCINNLKVCSNRVQLEVKKGRPFVSLTQESPPFFNECVQLKAAIRSFPKHDGVKWMKGKQYIDITQPQYEGSTDIGDSPILCINYIDKGDAARYKIKVHNEIGTSTCQIKKLKGEKPSVKLSKQSKLVTYGNTITLFATITARPAPSLIEWRKDNNIINVNDGKFVIDNSDHLNPQLSIRCLDFDDNGVYTVIVHNAFGSTKDEMEIAVKATDIIFISGPVVVSPSAKIQFQTVYPPTTNSAKGEWLIIKKNLSSKLQFGAPGYCIRTSGSKPTIQNIEITNPVENGSAFQLSVETTKSNIINIFVDDSGKFATEYEGNCLRFFELQSAANEAMRISLDSITGTFQMKWVKFENFCKNSKGKFLGLLPSNTPTSSNDLDVTVIYAMFRNTINILKPAKGWGQVPDKNDTKTADDIERVRRYRNKISHANSSEMETDEFNDSALDLISAIQRLTSNDEKLIGKMCVILNKLCCKGKELEKMMEDLKKFRDKAKKEENILRETEAPAPQEDTQLVYQRRGNEAIKFHSAHASDIVLGENGTFAIRNGGTGDGICFMNQPLIIGEKVHIRGLSGHYCKRFKCLHLNIGITSMRPETIFAAENKRQAILSSLKYVDVTCHKCTNDDHRCWGNPFHICISLCPNGSLFVSCNVTDKKNRYYNPDISINTPLWLVFVPSEAGSIWISHD